MTTFTLHPIGLIRSPLIDRKNAPRGPKDNAPEAWLEIDSKYKDALLGVKAGDQLIWQFHRTDSSSVSHSGTTVD